MINRIPRKTWRRIKPHVAAVAGPTHRKIGFALDLDLDTAMTGLPARSFLVRHLKQIVDEIKAGETEDVVVIYIDLDNFKWVNDTFGHDVADELLIQVAQKLKRLTERYGFAARVGGDEFVAVLKNQGSGMSAVIRAHEFHQAINGEYRVNGKPFDIEASFGFEWCGADLKLITQSHQKKDPHMILVDRAERGMYLARDAPHFGIPNILRYTHSAWEARQNKETYKRLLQKAILDGEFDVLYQPIISLSTGRVVAVEALMRPGGWESEVSLEQDMAIFEMSAVAPAFSTAVMSRVGHDMNQWDGQMAVRAHVNMSPNQIASNGTVARTRQMCASGLIDPNRMAIEITEREQLSPRKDIIPRLQELAKLGFRFALDDFGAAHSSLSRVLEFPHVDNIKLDGSLTREVQTSARARTIIGGMISALSEAGLSVTAEKVASADQARILAEMGCHFAQGYHFYRPLTQTKLLSIM